MRSYSVAIASLAIEAPQKWTDNVVSQHDIPDVVTVRRGVARRIPHSALVRLALARDLHATLGLGVGDAVRIAGELLDSTGGGVLAIGHLRLTEETRDVTDEARALPFVRHELILAHGMFPASRGP